MPSNQNAKKTVKGTVVSNKMQNTIVVSQRTKVAHKLYKKYITKTVKFVAHDADNVANIGDTVLIEQSRPLSKTKRWNLVEVIETQKTV